MSKIEESMRAAWHDATRRRMEIMRRSRPLREQRDKLLAETEAKVRAIDARIRDIEAPLLEIEQDRARLARALKGLTGPVVAA